MTSPSTRRELAFKLVDARSPTGRWRPLPNTLIIGAQRCGTSSLFKYLGAHPQCRASIRKEVRYFTEFRDRGVNWYRSHFPIALRPTHPRVYFEATPDYLLDPRVAQRVIELLPDVRVIVLLRDPIQRAYSHYWHNRRLGTERLRFDDALSRESERIGPALAAMENDPEIPTPKTLLRYSYAERGRYSAQITRWTQILPPERMLVMMSEDIFKRPDSTFQSVLQFLGLEAWRPKSYHNYSYENSKPVTPPMPEESRERLVEVLAEDMRELPVSLAPLVADLPDWATRVART